MSKNYIIETPRGAAGVVIKDRRGFLFFAASRDFDVLDGKSFATPERAARAANQQAQRLSKTSRAGFAGG